MIDTVIWSAVREKMGLCAETAFSSGRSLFRGQIKAQSNPKFSFILRIFYNYRHEIYSLQNLLSRTQAGPGRTVKKEQEEISPNHVQGF